MQRNLPSAFNKQTKKKESLLQQQQQQQRHRFLLACIQRDCTTSDSKQSPEWDCSFLATFLAPPSLPPPPTLFLFWLYLWLFPFLPPTTHPSLLLSWLTFFSSLSLFTLFLIVLPCCRDRAVTLTQFQKRGNNIVLQRIRTWNFICVSLFFFKFIVILELHLITVQTNNYFYFCGLTARLPPRRPSRCGSLDFFFVREKKNEEIDAVLDCFFLKPFVSTP